MADRDLVLSDPHLANDRANDPLTFGEGEGLCPFAQPPRKPFRRLGQRKPGATVKFRGLQGPEFRMDGTLPGMERDLSLPQFLKGHGPVLVSVEQTPHSSGDAGQLALQ